MTCNVYEANVAAKGTSPVRATSIMHYLPPIRHTQLVYVYHIASVDTYLRLQF